MAQAAKLVVKNLGLILSGKLEEPLLDGDCVVAVDGRITAIGDQRELDTDQASTVVDAKGLSLIHI